MVVISLFLTLLGLAMIYIASMRKAVIWPIFATVILFLNVFFCMSIPFDVNETGEIEGSTANFALMGINLLFGFLSFILSVIYVLLKLKEKNLESPPTTGLID